MTRDPLGLIFDTKTGKLVYSGFDTELQNQHYNEDPRNRLYLIHALYYTPEQCKNDPGIHLDIKNEDIKERINKELGHQLFKNLIVISDE